MRPTGIEPLLIFNKAYKFKAFQRFVSLCVSHFSPCHFKDSMRLIIDLYFFGQIMRISSITSSMISSKSNMSKSARFSKNSLSVFISGIILLSPIIIKATSPYRYPDTLLRLPSHQCVSVSCIHKTLLLRWAMRPLLTYAP